MFFLRQVAAKEPFVRHPAQHREFPLVSFKTKGLAGRNHPQNGLALLVKIGGEIAGWLIPEAIHRILLYFLYQQQLFFFRRCQGIAFQKLFRLLGIQNNVQLPLPHFKEVNAQVGMKKEPYKAAHGRNVEEKSKKNPKLHELAYFCIMFFILSKILAFLLSPLTWIFTLMCFALFSKNPVRKRRYFISSIAVLYFFSNPFFADEFMRLWEVTTPDLKPSQRYEYAIVLGGMIDYDARQDRPQFMRGADRLLQTLPLLKSGQVKKIIITSGSGSILRQDEKEADILKNYLVKAGIPDSCIITESQSRNTYENAQMTKVLLDRLQVEDSILFVTSAFHLRRAKGCFEKAGINKLVLYPTDRYSGPRKLELDHLLVPNPGTLSQWELLIHEITGYLVYKLRGYC